MIGTTCMLLCGFFAPPRAADRGCQVSTRPSLRPLGQRGWSDKAKLGRNQPRDRVGVSGTTDSLSSPALCALAHWGGESNTPRPLGSITAVSGILDRPVEPSDDSECVVTDTPSQPRGAIHPSFASSLYPLSQEGAGKAGCQLAPTVRCAKSTRRKNRTAAYRCSQSLGLPCAVVGRLMPCSPGSRVRSGLPRLRGIHRRRAG